MNAPTTGAEMVSEFLAFIEGAYGSEARSTAQKIIDQQIPDVTSNKQQVTSGDLEPVFRQVLRSLYPHEVLAAELPFSSD